MSQKSTARTASEGDVEFKDTRNINPRPASSSGKSKRDIFGGPFGDSPYDQVQDAYQDYLLIMFHNNEDTPGTSESSQADRDLYNLRYNYTEQINLVRKQLNLMEISEDEHQRCTITEILDEESGKSNEKETHQRRSSSVSQRQTSSGKVFSETNPPKGYELTTIHPFSLNYNIESKSSTNVQPDYSPPTKRVCQRMKTPRFASVSESNVPYHTKIGIHDSLFKKDSNSGGKGKNFVKNTVKQFTETRQTQCTEAEFNDIERVVNLEHSEDKFSVLNLSFETDSDSEYESPNSGSLFPNVIIETKRGQVEEESSLSPQSSKQCTTTSSSTKDSFKKTNEMNILPLNSVRGSSDDDDAYTVRVSNTTIDTSEQKKKTKWKMSKKQKASMERLTMWDEITRLRSGTDDNKVEKGADGDVAKTGESTYDICKINSYVAELSQTAKLSDIVKKDFDKGSRGDGKTKLNQYIRQYVQYKTEVEKVKLATTKKHNKHTLIGQRFVNIQNRILDSPDKLYQSENSLVSDEDKCGKVTSTPGNSSVNEDRRRFWERFCFCLCPSRNFSD